MDRGLKPSRFARLWVHTHPGNSAEPSWLDEETFARVFGATDWAVMFILAQGGQTYARLRFNVGPRAALALPVAVDYGRPFPASDFAAWDREYQASVQPLPVAPPEKANDPTGKPTTGEPPAEGEVWYESWDDWMFDNYQNSMQERSLYDR